MRAPARALLAAAALLAACGPASHAVDGGPAPDAGTPVPPVIEAPAAVDLGTFSDGACPRGEAEVCFDNVGAQDAVLEAVELSGGDAFGLRALPALPASVAPGDAVCATVRFLGAAGGGAFAATLATRFAGLEAPVEVALSAEDATDYRREDVFHQLEPPKADLLLVLDDAPLTSALRLEENLHAFADFLIHQGVLTRVALTTTALSDDGALLPLGAPAIFDVHDDGFLAAFDAAVAGRPVRDDTPDQGLSAVLRTLERHPDVVRDGVALAAIVASAGDDADAATLAVEDFVTDLLAFKGGPRHANLVSFSAVAGPPPDGCSFEDGTAIPTAARYREAVSVLGGVFGVACKADWYRGLFNLYFTTGDGYRSTYFLEAVPVVETLEVQAVDMDGRPYETTWTYDAALNAIVFDPMSIPSPGSTLRVTYQLAPCEAP